MRLLRLTVLSLLTMVLACAPRATTPAAATAPALAKRAATVTSDLVAFTGACDASGAVVLDRWLFAVGDDEDNVLRLYDAEKGGASVGAVDLSPSLGLFGKKRPPELDIEAATGLGEYALWITSHGRTSSGKLAPSRLQFFATTRVAEASQVTVVGKPYVHLLEDLLADPRLAQFGLAAASELAPKEPGGLNLEGMTASLDDRFLWIGFRSPLPAGNTLLVPLENPLEVIRGEARARLGEPVLLDLGGLGVRSLSTWRGRYLIAAGATTSGGESRLFLWDGTSTPMAVATRFDGFNPEAFVTPEDEDSIFVLSDDGARLVDGVECKKLEEPQRKSFRAVRLYADDLQPVTASAE